jgi:tetratricopeptide (TPR) repeat protein
MRPADQRDAAWEEAKRVFMEAMEQPAAERGAYLDRACAQDAMLRGEVESLIENHDDADSFFEQPPVVQAVRTDPLIGQRVGAHRVLRTIGRGGMGIVYLAERADGEFRRRVALKALNPDFLDEHTLRRFENERRTLAVLDHPNIIKLLDGGTTDDGVPFLVTDYVEGQPIDEYCATRQLPMRDRLRLFREVLGAVHYAHQNLIVHRDLKPSNIFVTPEGVPKLLDFGIAKLMRPEYLGGPMGLTRTAMQPLTPEFASPEQVQGQPITTASDIYSLGVILYRLLTGRHPFERKTSSLLELEHAICETEPERPSVFAMSGSKAEAATAKLLRGDLDNIVLMAMRKEPQRRYASAEHFSEVRRHLEGWPVLARRSSGWYRASKFVGRHRAGCAAGVVLTAGLLASATAAFQQQRLATRRFNQLRSFANFVIRDSDNVLREGGTRARKRLNAEALHYLDAMSREADSVLWLDLAEGYTRAGDVQGNPHNSNLGDRKAAEESYVRALGFAQKLAQSGARDAVSRLALSKAQIGLADVLWARGEGTRAFGLYHAATGENDAVLASDRANKEAGRSNYLAWDHMMMANEERGDIPAALDCAGQCLKYVEAMGKADQAYIHERHGRLLVLEGNAGEGEGEIRGAIATYEALGHAAGTAPQRRNLAKAYKSLGDGQRIEGELAEAERSYRRSLTDSLKLMREDPRSAVHQLDVGQAYAPLIEVLLERGDKAGAHRETAAAMGELRPIAENARASMWELKYYYAWLLVTTPFADLRDDGAAAKLAQKMAQAAPRDPEVLDVQARVAARAGDIESALAMERSALAAKPNGEVRARIENEISALSGAARPMQRGR